jgi:glycosyltransferase involved in cell wall biosynthesis
VDPTATEEIAVAMHRLLTDDGLHAELRLKGFQRAASFNWKRAAIETLAVYQKVADVHAPSAPRIASTVEES